VIDDGGTLTKKKRILLVDLGTDRWSREIINRLSQNTLYEIFGTGSTSPTGSHFFASFLVRGNPHESGIDVSEDSIKFTVDKDLYREIRCFEGATIRMLDRVDGFRLWQRNDISKRRNYFFREAAFWSSYLSENSIEAVVFANIPHEGFDFIIYNLCISRNIPTLILFHTFSIDTFAFTVTESIESVGNFEVACRLKATSKFAEPSDFKDRLKHDFMGTKVKKTTNINDEENNVSNSELVDSIQASIQLKNSSGYLERIIRRFLRIRTRIEYARVSKVQTLPNKFVFFPLHVEPELAISPSGGHFEEQYEAIRFLVSRLPEGWKVVVKEHPHQAGFGPRPIGFYEKIAMISNVNFVETAMNSLEIIGSSQSVATITGSAGVEAVRLGKPSWVLGYPWYLSSPGVTRIDTGEDLARAFENLSVYKPITNADLEKYVTSLHEAHFYGFIPGFPDHASQNELLEVNHSTIENISLLIKEWLQLRLETSSRPSVS
jgi:hypothetical protein